MPSTSKSQRRLFGLAYSIKKAGKNSDKYKNANNKIKELVDSMTLKDLEDYASTKETDLPEKVEEKFGYFESFEDYCSKN